MRPGFPLSHHPEVHDIATTSGGVPLLHSVVASEAAEGAGEVAHVNPARPDEVVAFTTRAGTDVVSQAVAAARAAQPGWRRCAAGVRARILYAAADRLERDAESIGRDLTREEGKTLAEAVGEVRRAADVFRYFAGQALEPDGQTYPSSSPTTLLYARRSPLGVVAVITPWNFPIALPAWKLAPALVYGNTVVWKPAENVPMTSARLVAALTDAGLPPGVLNLVQGSGSIAGAALIADPEVDAVTFTGSNDVGRGILAVAGTAGKRVQLELGGKNPAVVLADADLEHASRTIARAAFLMAGQKCTATSRVIVERAVCDEFGALLASDTDALAVGDPLDPRVQVGPLATAQQFASVRTYVEEGETAGRRLTGRDPFDVPSGYFVAPVVYTDVAASSPLHTDEIFGPVVTLVAADSYEHAVELANATPFGLSSSLFTSSLGRALRFSDDIDTGIVKINQESSGLEINAPFGGMKGSGHGPQEQGKAAVEFFTRWKTTYVDRVAE